MDGGNDGERRDKDVKSHGERMELRRLKAFVMHNRLLCSTLLPLQSSILDQKGVKSNLVPQACLHNSALYDAFTVSLGLHCKNPGMYCTNVSKNMIFLVKRKDVQGLCINHMSK